MKKLYITFKEQMNYSWELKRWVMDSTIPLGYASSTDSKGNFSKKKHDSQNYWAYQEEDSVNGIFVNTRPYDYTKQEYANIPEPYKYQPKYYDNEALEGFTLQSVATRYSTSNKLFRVSDPRGFELEISADNLLEIINNTTIKNGEIMSKCEWDFGKNGIGKAKLVLVG